MKELGHPRRIILHCTDTPDEPGREMHVSPFQIHSWHVERGFTMVGYHFLVSRDGTVHPMRPLFLTGAHCKGANGDSIGIAWTGRSHITDEQIDALKRLIRQLREQFGESLSLHGHREFSSKTCPNINLEIL